MFIHPSNMPISTAKCKKTGLGHTLAKISTASTKISTDGVYAAAHFYNYEPELCRNTFLFSVWRMWCSSTTTPPEYYWTTSPTSSGLLYFLFSPFHQSIPLRLSYICTCLSSCRSSNGSSTWRHLISYKNMLRAIENIGVEMSLGLRFYARNELSRVS